MSELMELEVRKVVATADNPREIRENDPKLKELAESIRAVGQLQPVICRPHPTKAGFYDLRAGARRLAAIRSIGGKKIVAVVSEMSDKEAMRATVLENLQREDLGPMEEGRAVAALVKSGQTLAWVARRAQLVHLIPEWEKALPELFHDDAEPAENLGKHDRCLKGECFDAKLAYHLVLREKELQGKHANLVKVSTEYSREPGVLRRIDYEAVKKSAPGALPAMYVDGKQAGTLTWVKKTEYAAEHEKETGPKSLKKKRAELENKRWCEVVKRFREVLEKTPIDKLDRPELAVLLAATFGTGPIDGEWENYEALKALPANDAQLTAAAGELWDAVRYVLSGELNYIGPVTQYGWDDVKEFVENVAALIHFDLKELYGKVCGEKGFGTPKSWGESE